MRCWPLFIGGAARGLRCRTRHPSRGSHPVWLLDFCRCSNQKCCAVQSELCANAAKLQWLAPTLPGLLRARHVGRSADARQLGFDGCAFAWSIGVVHGFRRRNRADIRAAVFGTAISPGCRPMGMTFPSLPNSVQMRKIPDPEQPPVREDRVRSVAIARARLIAFVGVKGLPKPAFRVALTCSLLPLPMDSRRCRRSARWVGPGRRRCGDPGRSGWS